MYKCNLALLAEQHGSATRTPAGIIPDPQPTAFQTELSYATAGTAIAIAAAVFMLRRRKQSSSGSLKN